VEHPLKTASILIRTKNEARAVGATLDAVFSQGLPPHEVFIIDSGSRDQTLKIASGYPVKIVRMAPKGWSYSRALNVGARQATGEFLVCLSAHCPPVSEDWLANLLRHFDDPSVAAVWGPHHPNAAAKRGLVRQEKGNYSFESRQHGLSNHNSAIRRSLWLQFPFDESLPAAEDKGWAREAMGRGYAIIYDPAAAVLHGRHPALNAFRRARAIRAGYKILFPELRSSPWAELIGLGRRIRKKLVSHARQRDGVTFLTDAKKLPSLVAELLGRLLPNR
jgi:glycosyltransferase involved in cell wall biosynthesis